MLGDPGIHRSESPIDSLPTASASKRGMNRQLVMTALDVPIGKLIRRSQEDTAQTSPPPPDRRQCTSSGNVAIRLSTGILSRLSPPP